MKGILFFIVALLPFCGYAESYDSLAANKFINTFLKDNTERIDGSKYIVASLYASFYNSFFKKKDIYFELQEYLSPFQIDSLERECQVISRNFCWRNESLVLDVIDSNRAKLIIDSVSTNFVVHSKKCRTKKVVRPKLIATVFSTSPPLFFKKDYCLLLYSRISGMTVGTICLVLYKKDANGNWKEEKTISCVMS